MLNVNNYDTVNTFNYKNLKMAIKVIKKILKTTQNVFII